MNASNQEPTFFLPFLGPASFVTEKAKGRGEDSPVLLAQLPTSGATVVAVFDGMGGSGARTIVSETDSAVTAAAYASSLAFETAAKTLFEFGFVIGGVSPHPSSDSGYIPWAARTFVRQLEHALSDAFLIHADRVYGSLGRGIRGSIAKRLPTTACLMVAEPRSDYGINLTVAWSGDSRAYVWTADHGLAQLSRDHTRQPVDAMRALTEESPLSRFVSADRPTAFELWEIDVRSPCLYFCATDGAFNYFTTPMDFEVALLEALVRSTNWASFIANFRSHVQSVTGDDASLGISGWGWIDFEHIRSDASSWLAHLRPQTEALAAIVAAVDRAELGAQEARDAYESEKAKLETARFAAWRAYQPRYERMLAKPSSNDSLDDSVAK